MSTPTHLPPGTRKHARAEFYASLMSQVALGDAISAVEREQLRRAAASIREAERDAYVPAGVKRG
jgi:hypothetical protein